MANVTNEVDLLQFWSSIPMTISFPKEARDGVASRMWQ